MAGNATPQFTKNGNVGAVAITAANTKSDGAGTIGTDIFKAFTAGADGAYVDFVRFMAYATTAATTTTATVGRVFISSQTSGATTVSNTWLVGEVPLPAVSADATTTAVNAIDFPLGFRIPAGYTILVTTHHTPAASSGQLATVFGGDY